MPPLLTDSLVRSVRAHGESPAGGEPDAPRWREVADSARALALGLAAAGVGPGRTVHVERHGLTAVEVVERELAVLATGAVLRVAAPGSEREVVVGRTRAHVGGGPDPVALDRLRDDGRRVAAADPDAHERTVADLGPDAPVLADGARVVDQAEAGRAIRAVDRWLEAATGGRAPGVVGSPAPEPGTEVVAALLGRWWPASCGGRISAPGPDVTSLRRSRPDVVVLSPAEWALLAEGVRAAASRTAAGRALLRTGRALAAGEEVGSAERAAGAVATWRIGPRLRDAVGLGTATAGIVLGGLDPVDARDLATAGVRVVPTWVEPGVPAPVAAGAVRTPSPPSSWLRPLPGRVVEISAGVATLRGDDLPQGVLRVGTTAEVDGRGRVRPRRTSGAGR